VLHEVKPGESFPLLADNYHTTTEVIRALNSRQGSVGLWVGEVLVIMPGQTNPYGLPKFKVILLDQARTVNQLAEEYGVPASELQIYNSLGPESDNIPAGRWIIIPVGE
jgi:LysM repeat protein